MGGIIPGADPAKLRSLMTRFPAWSLSTWQRTPGWPASPGRDTKKVLFCANKKRPLRDCHGSLCLLLQIIARKNLKNRRGFYYGALSFLVQEIDPVLSHNWRSRLVSPNSFLPHNFPTFRI